MGEGTHTAQRTQRWYDIIGFAQCAAVLLADIDDMSEPLLLPAVFQHLRHKDNLAVDATLVEALPHMDPEVRPAALKLLLQRDHRPSLVLLVGRFRQYDEDMKRLTAAHVGALFGAVRGAIESPIVQRRAGAIQLITESRCGPLVYLLADALRHQCAQTRELAGKALHELAVYLSNRIERRSESPSAPRHHGSEPQAPPPDSCTSGSHSRLGEMARIHAQSLRGNGLDEVDALATGLGEALRRAVLGWEIHRNRHALEAALWMSDRVAAAIRTKLEDPRSKIAHSICSMVQTAHDPRMAGFTLRALSLPQLRTAAAEALAREDDTAFWSAVLNHSWLLLDPEIERACRRIRESPRRPHNAHEWVKLHRDMSASAVHLLDSVGWPRERKTMLFRELVRAGTHACRAAVGWHLVHDNGEAATALLTTLTGLCPGELGRMATRELDRRRLRGSLQTCQNAPAATHTRTAARRAFDRYWEEFDLLPPRERASVTDSMRQIADRVLGPIREKLASEHSQDRCRAVRIARALRLTSELDEHIYPLGHDADPVVRSAAVGALAALPGATSARILRHALADRDERVQANAITAVEALGTEELVAKLPSKLASHTARVRANAIMSLLRLEQTDGAAALLEMLADARSDHRMSALWVVEQLGLRSVSNRVTQISRYDPDGDVRAVARRVLGRLNRASEPGTDLPQVAQPLACHPSTTENPR
ncbi:MAG: HEAT repeat domain-containing protein [Phycisphaerae bacterium]